MPTSGYDYDKHGRPARVKPRKEQDNRSITSGPSSRRHRDSSASSTRTALPPECLAQRPESTPSNVNLDQLPSLPESESGSPSSTSSPMLRTISTISTSTSLTLPTVPHTPAFLQPYLEPESGFLDTADDSQATPKAEKTKDQCEAKAGPIKVTRQKIEPPKIQPRSSDPEPSKPTRKTSSESSKAASIRSSPRAVAPPSLNQEAQYEDLHQPAPKHPIPTNLALAPEPLNPAPPYSYGNASHDQQIFHSPQMAYLPLPHQADPSSIQHALAPHSMIYYPDYGPPPPVPEPPHQLHYPRGPENRLRNEHPMALLNRVHCAMPDLYALLDSYHEICGVLESRESQVRTLEAQRAAENRQQEDRFVKLEEEMVSLSKKHSAERNRLRMEISVVDKKCKEMQGRLTAEEKSKDALEAINEGLRVDRRQLIKKYEEDKAAMIQKLSLDRDRMITEHRAKQRTSHDELQAHNRKAEATLAHQDAHLNRAHEEEKHRLEAMWTKQKREIEDRHEKLHMDLEDKLEAKQKILDEERRTYLQAREGWDRERETITRRWDEERTIMRKASEEQSKAITTRHERERNDILRQVSPMQQRSDKEDNILKLQKEVEMLRSGWEADKFRFQRTTAEFKSTARTLNEHNSKLQRLTEAFGDVVEVKGK